MRARELMNGFRKRIGLFFELQELWWLTRNPDDPRFKYIVDFTTALGEAKIKLSSIDFTDSYSKWRDDVNTIIGNLKIKIRDYQNTSELKGKSKRRFNALVDDMGAYLDKINISEHYSRGVAYLTSYLTNNIRLVENFALKNVAKRRKITSFWSLTCERIKEGKIFHFILSIPKIFISIYRDIKMSLYFAYHLINRTTKHQN